MIKMLHPRFRFYGFPQNYLQVAGHVSGLRRAPENAVRQTESMLAAHLGVAHVILVPQGRVGIHLGLKALLKPGQHVILSPYTLYDVVNMVIAAGCIPRFVDVRSEDGNICPEAVAHAIGPETGAILATHLHGIAARMEELVALGQKFGVPVLEDACQAFGGRIGDRFLGTIGKMGFFSTGRAKNLNSFLGGFVVTDDEALAACMREHLAAWDKEDPKRLSRRILHCLVGDLSTMPLVFSVLTGHVFRYGVMHDVGSLNRQFNTEANPQRRAQLPETYRRRITPMQARLIAAQLSSVDRHCRERLEKANLYAQGLMDLPGVRLPPSAEGMRNIFLTFPVQVEDRLALQKHLAASYCDVAIQHIGCTSDLDMFRDHAVDCKNARKVAQSVLLLPTYPGYSRSSVLKLIAAIRTFYGAAAA